MGTKTVNGFIAFGPIPGGRGRHRAAPPVLAPESALGSRPRVALSPAQVSSVYLAGLWPGNFFLCGLGSPLGAGRRQLHFPGGPDEFGDPIPNYWVRVEYSVPGTPLDDLSVGSHSPIMAAGPTGRKQGRSACLLLLIRRPACLSRSLAPTPLSSATPQPVPPRPGLPRSRR